MKLSNHKIALLIAAIFLTLSGFQNFLMASEKTDLEKAAEKLAKTRQLLRSRGVQQLEDDEYKMLTKPKAAEQAELIAASEISAAEETIATQPQPTPSSLTPEANFKNFTLEQAINLALTNNRQIIKARQNIKKADGSLEQAQSISAPKLSISGTLTKLNEDIVPGEDVNSSAALNLNLPIYLGEKDKIAVKSAKLGKKIADTADYYTKQNVILQVSMTYYSWLYAAEVEKVSLFDLELSKAHLELVNKKLKAQQASQYEVLRAEVRVNQCKTAWMKSQNSTKLAELDLLNLLALSPDTKISTSEKLQIEKIDANPKRAIESAKNLRADLKIKKASYDIAEHSYRAAKANNTPNVSLFGNYGYDKPTPMKGSTSGDTSWKAGIAISWDFYDGGSTSGKIKAALAEKETAKQEYLETLEKAETDIHKSFLSLNTAREMVLAQTEDVKQAEETLRLANVRYENGLFTQVDLFDAENAFSNSKLRLLAAIFGHHQARLSYLLSAGVLGQELNLQPRSK